MAIDDGGQAFPGERSNRMYAGGMSLRDYFAAAAMSAMFADGTRDLTVKEVTRHAYEYADAMIAEKRRV